MNALGATFAEQPCPSCGYSLRYAVRPMPQPPPFMWAACCDANLMVQNGKLTPAGTRAHDWVRREGEMHTG